MTICNFFLTCKNEQKNVRIMTGFNNFASSCFTSLKQPTYEFVPQTWWLKKQ